MEFVTEFEGRTPKDVRQRMDEVMTARGEGLILKHPDSEYILNGRTKDWIKVKPEYMVYSLPLFLACCSFFVVQDDLGETVDVLVVGKHYVIRAAETC